MFLRVIQDFSPSHFTVIIFLKVNLIILLDSEPKSVLIADTDGRKAGRVKIA